MTQGGNMEKIKTATGKEFDCDYVSVLSTPKWAYIRIYNTDIGTVATVFSNPAETKTLTFGAITLDGYTRMRNLVPESNCIRVTLEKE